MKRDRRTGPVAPGSPPPPAVAKASSGAPPPNAPPARDAAVWHELECGAYRADLSLWEELAGRTDGAILDLGCGTGRVATHLAQRGHEVVGIDRDTSFVSALERRAGALPATALVGDARNFDAGRRFGLVLAPMQLVQLLAGPAERARCLRCVAAHLSADGLAAFAIVESMPEPVEAAPALPDAREVDGWVYSSLPVETLVEAEAIRVRRLRQTVAPEGELEEELSETLLYRLDAGRLEAEGAEAGLRSAGRLVIPATDDHVGSTVVLLGGGA